MFDSYSFNFAGFPILCRKLTDSSFEVISETCPGLCAIDLVNLSKLTDFAIGYLANGCRAIQKLKLCRNSFRLLPFIV